jgi:hypothetical protein
VDKETKETNVTEEAKESKEENEPYGLRQALAERGKATITMLADTALLAAWVMITWFFNTYCLARFGRMAGLDEFTLDALQLISAVPVICQAISFTVVDVSTILSSAFRIVRDQWRK